jgi:hypothetical protein
MPPAGAPPRGPSGAAAAAAGAVAAAAAAAGAAGPRFSIKREFSGAGVLITGATGYVGGLVLESLLRTTDVGRVFVLLRGKKNQAVSERADKLLQGPMFHLVRDKPALLSKVTAVAGDLGQPGLGLSPADLRKLADGVDVLIHSAADIRLEAPIQVRAGGAARSCARGWGPALLPSAGRAGRVAARVGAAARAARQARWPRGEPSRQAPNPPARPPPKTHRRRCAPTTWAPSACCSSRCSCQGARGACGGAGQRAAVWGSPGRLGAAPDAAKPYHPP